MKVDTHGFNIGSTVYVDNTLKVKITSIMIKPNASIYYGVSWINKDNDIKYDVVGADRVSFAAPTAVTDLRIVLK